MVQAKTTKALIIRTALADTILLAAACLIPAASHLLGVPLYKANPMLALMLGGIIAGKHTMPAGNKAWINGLILAFLMPLCSSLITGMPESAKTICMIAELTTISTIIGYGNIASKMASNWPIVFGAILAGKVVYYGLKALLMAPVVLIGTEWWIQLLTIALWGGIFVFATRPRQ